MDEADLPVGGDSCVLWTREDLAREDRKFGNEVRLSCARGSSSHFKDGYITSQSDEGKIAASPSISSPAQTLIADDFLKLWQWN